MPYKACYDCELLFEVDGTSAEMVCTECGAVLVDYTPDADELDQLEDEATEGETLMLTADQVASGMSSGVVATMAIEGLAAKLRAAAEKGGSPDALLPQRRNVERTPTPTPAPQPVRVEPSPRAVEPVAVAQPAELPATGVIATPQPALPTLEAPEDKPFPPAPARIKNRATHQRAQAGGSQGKARATKMLDVSELDPNEWGADGSQPVPALPAFGDDSQPAVPPPFADTPPATPQRPIAAPRKVVKKKKKSKAGLLIAIVVLIGAAGGGVAAWYFTQKKPTDVEQPQSTPSEAPPQTFEGQLGSRLEDTAVRLPKVGIAQPLDEGQYLIAGMEGLVFSAGQVPGLASARLNDAVIGTQDGREFVTPVRAAFDRAGLATDTPFSFALDNKLPARDLLRFAYSAHLAGAQKQALIVRGNDGFAQVGYGLQIGPLGAIADGVLVVRVGKIGFHVTVKDAGGNVISTAEPRIPLRDDRSLDMSALNERLDTLVGAHAGVRTGVVFPSPEMVSGDLVAILARLARGASGPRFPDVRIALP